ncbi:DUF3299 domain-containing protein [Vibrio agarivorans]|uniref:DUF3299 domain-containing protein n=1 Tax=Vibrio agarivorans TaxID=153622 RepID=UPI0025B594E0|nr:DUF3299 domain-containing protein [Vibrio agarivorans]MDN3659854.1 DUF3299 domain-containing protein [Vibrio agarivorans]
MLRHFLVLISCIGSAGLYAAATQTISWIDLVPPASEEVSLPPLNEYQVGLIYKIVAYQNAEKRRDMSAKETATYEQNVADFTATKADLASLLALREKAIEVEKARYSSVDPSMKFDEVTIGGFMVPLEMDGLTTKKFLLVPTAGACIHTPPPPINQIIVVDIEQGYELVDLFQPIAVSGDIKVSQQELNVDYIDGNTDVSAGYVMKASDIRLY